MAGSCGSSSFSFMRDLHIAVHEVALMYILTHSVDVGGGRISPTILPTVIVVCVVGDRHSD
jgi:hypothetical protein